MSHISEILITIRNHLREVTEGKEGVFLAPDFRDYLSIKAGTTDTAAEEYNKGQGAGSSEQDQAAVLQACP